MRVLYSAVLNREVTLNVHQFKKSLMLSQRRNSPDFERQAEGQLTKAISGKLMHNLSRESFTLPPDCNA
jgi:hypothetical protein